MKELKPWAEKQSSNDFRDRVATMNAVLENFGSLSAKAENLVKSIEDQKEFRKLSYLTHLHYIPLDKKYPDTAQLIRFDRPMVAVSHKKLPLIVAVGDKFVSKGVPQLISDMEKSFEVKQNLGWVRAVSHMNREEKNKLADLIIEGIKSYRQSKSSQEKWLTDFIRDEKEFKLLGFAVNIPYINVDSKWGDTKPLWIHPWGTPQLLLWIKGLPAIMIVGPTIRLNENIFGDRSMEGYTG